MNPIVLWMDFDVFGKGAPQARLYDPIIGRWWSIDPLRAKYAGKSPYLYANGNPLFFIDREGKENIPALIWAAENMANKGIASSYDNPYFGGSDNRWKYTIGAIPDRTVCYESCFMAYMNSGEEVVNTLKTGFTNSSNSFYGRSTAKGGENWFKAGNGSDRSFVTDITKGELGDIVFMGNSAGMHGHAVLLASEITISTEKVGDKVIEKAKFYALSTSSDTDEESYGGREFTFIKDSKGGWTQEGGSNYKFRGFGQMKNVKATDEQREQAAKAIENVKNP